MIEYVGPTGEVFLVECEHPINAWRHFARTSATQTVECSLCLDKSETSDFARLTSRDIEETVREAFPKIFRNVDEEETP